MVLGLIFIALFMLIERFIYFFDNIVDVKRLMKKEKLSEDKKVE